MPRIRPPLCFTFGNLVFANDLNDAWACFHVGTHSFDGLSIEHQIGHFDGWRALLNAIGHDFQVVRLGTTWDADAWAADAAARCAPERAELADRRIAATMPVLDHVGVSVPRVFIAVRLAEPRQDIGTRVSRVFERSTREWLDHIKQSIAWRDRRAFDGAALERLRLAAGDVEVALAECLRDVRPARPAELQWWVRRQFTRGLGEPEVDHLHEPSALVLQTNGEAVLQPLEGDVLRWMDSYVVPRATGLHVTSELGESYQSMLVLGALPEYAMFPSRRLQLMFSPAEALPFPVDLTLNCRFVPNDLAIRMTRRRIQDADEIARAESMGDQGASEQAMSRMESVRHLLSHLQSTSRPPLMWASVSIAVGAPTAKERAQRVAACRRQWGPEVKLAQPIGDQLQVFCQHFPGQPSRAIGYDAPLTVEQVAALMPSATHKVGPRRGFFRGYTITGSRQPVLHNLSEGSERNSATGIVLTGAPGRGKTQLTQALFYEAFLQGARIVDIEAKGDHQFHRLAEVAEHAETIEPRPDPRLRGLIDPMRVAPLELRDDAAISFLTGLLPRNVAADWQTAVHKAVAAVSSIEREPTCTHVITVLKQGSRVDVEVGEALETFAQHGLTQLGFGDPDHPLPPVGSKQVTYIPIRHLPGADADVPRADRTRDEQIGDQILHLITLFAMGLLAREPDRLKVFGCDEAHRLLKDSTGRRLLTMLNRQGRSELAVLILATQLTAEVLASQAEVLNLVGEIFAFGVVNEEAARRALTMIGRDPESAVDRERFLALAAEGNEGRCFYRDHDANVELIQNWIPRYQLDRTDTNPTRRKDAGRSDARAA
jgi:hypothetical protein